jgi:adenine-specific DNA-methyltransferase
MKDLLARTDETRIQVGQELCPERRSTMGQFMTPAPVASFMASMFTLNQDAVRLLDAGAGVGSLTAAYVAEACGRPDRPESIEATAFEVEPHMLPHLRRTFESCAAEAEGRGTSFRSRVETVDFIEAAVARLTGSLFQPRADGFNAAILNPPYRKIRSGSRDRDLLRQVGIETTNLYAAFVSLAIRLLESGGELVAITPRSFCNGPYFRSFRAILLNEATLLRVHVFASRKQAFREDQVLQENVIFHVQKGARRGPITLSTSSSPRGDVTSRRVPYDLVIDPTDRNAFIHLAVSANDADVAQQMRDLPCTLSDIGLNVSTGRVVDFRARDQLRADPEPRTVPLIYPAHFNKGFVDWPVTSKKPNALLDIDATQGLMVRNDVYVLTKRFTSKEERRRIVAAVYDPRRLPDDVKQVGFENHLNYFHSNGSGLPTTLAKGLTVYLNSTLVDQYFRQFNGHTQVNAGDLRSLRYPHPTQLKAMGRRFRGSLPDQERVDQIVAELA